MIVNSHSWCSGDSRLSTAIRMPKRLNSQSVGSSTSIMRRSIAYFATTRTTYGTHCSSQPETLLVFERLETNPFTLKDRWQSVLPLELLESTAAVWGMPL